MHSKASSCWQCALKSEAADVRIPLVSATRLRVSRCILYSRFLGISSDPGFHESERRHSKLTYGGADRCESKRTTVESTRDHTSIWSGQADAGTQPIDGAMAIE